MDDRTVRFHNRATILFVLLAGLAVIAIALTFVADMSWPVRIVGILTYALTIVASAMIVRGLDRQRPWAVPTTIVACAILIAAGIIQVAYDLTQATITIPLAAIGAGVVLLVDPRPPGARALVPSKPLVATTLCLVIGLAAPVVTAALSHGWLFGNSPDDLTVAVTLDCQPGAGSSPTSATINTDWHWTRSEPFPSSYDAIVVRWRTEDEGGDFFLAAQPAIDESAGLWVGASSPSAERAQEIEAEGQPTVTVGIDLAKQQYANGRVQVSLTREPVTTPHGMVVADAVYIHQDRWEQVASEVTCEW